MTTLERLEAALKAHDWFYTYSDDHRTWCKGEAQSREIEGLLREATTEGQAVEANRLYHQYLPKSLKEAA